VKVYTYGGRAAALWWEGARDRLERPKNLTVIDLPLGSTRALAALAQRNMRLQCNVQEGLVWVGDGAATVQIEPLVVRGPRDF
jgi:uncharacterized protein YaeQ